MAYFKSDSVDIVKDTYINRYANIPTGALVPIAGPITLYSNAEYVSLGLLPCNGTVREISSYQNLYNVLTVNGSVFPFGTNTLADGTTSGNTHFKLPNMLATKYWLSGSNTGNISIPNNSATHTHSVNSSGSASANNDTWNHTHAANAGTSTSNMNAHNHAFPAQNASSAGNGGSVVLKNDASGPTAASPSHSHGSFNFNGVSSSNQNAGGHDHGNALLNSNAAGGGSHTHTVSYSINAANSQTVYPDFESILYFVKA